jgi:NAD(P)-dependent dehydrogenase (short-subunit alcohol dehydrogenase family)
VVHYSRSAAESSNVVRLLNAAGVKACRVRRELRSGADCEKLLDDAWMKAGPVNILVNNAAVFSREGLLAASEKRILAQLRTNAIVPMLLTRAFAGRVARGGGAASRGRVVNLLDRRITGNETGCVPYLLSKKMLADFTRAAALELAPFITVNGVAPGAVLPPARGRGGRVSEPGGTVPLGRRCTPREVADAVVFLVEADAITGQIVFVDGGQHL